MYEYETQLATELRPLDINNINSKDLGSNSSTVSANIDNTESSVDKSSVAVPASGLSMFGFGDSSISKTDAKYNWFTTDEIKYKKHAFGRKIAPELTAIFESDPRITEIKPQDGKAYPCPSVLYMCEKPEDLYHNLYITKENEHLEPSIIDTMISHTIFGEGYTFSSMPLDKDTKSDFSYESLKRYAVFSSESAQYILKDIANLTEEEKAGLLANNTDKDVITIYYHENGLQLWHVYSANWFTVL